MHGRHTHGTPFDPNQDARSLSTNTISVMSSAVFGNILGPVVSGDLLGYLGLGSSGGAAAYLQKIEAQLEQMQVELVQLQQSINQIAGTLEVIEERFDDVTMQAKLDSFAAHATLVHTNFKTYTNAIHALTSSDRGLVGQAARELFELADLDLMTPIATAMSVIQDLFVPADGEAQGLVDLQHHYVRSPILAFAQNRENYRYAGKDPCLLPVDGGLFAASRIVSNGHDTADRLLKGEVAGLFKMFVTAQTQGLILLNFAYLGTPQEPQIADQVTGIHRVLDAMTAFEAPIRKTVNDEINSCLQQFGVPLSGRLISWDTEWMIGLSNKRELAIGTTCLPAELPALAI